ncbi:LysR family transcriptional regulator [Agaribacter flavus]|uniref:LysR family transcriptional regulator n=1 Tax=Agaribacter flavus TaxID=1902781 RepID=A0ABV7FS33_9ALTE
MDLRQLKYFKTVVEQGGVHKASERLHISQPAITTSIKKLESYLKTSLFEKQGRNLKATADGMKLYQHACKLLAHSQNIIGDMRANTADINETITIFSPPIIAQSFIQDSLNYIIQCYPRTQIKLVIEAGINIHCALLNGEVDIGFSAHHPTTDRLDTVRFYKENLRIIMNSSHELVRENNLSWEKLLAYDFITLPSQYILKSKLNKVAEYYNLPLKVRMETNSLTNILKTISHSELIAILPESVCHKCESVQSMRLPNSKKLSHVYQETIELYALTNSQSTIKPQVKALIEYLVEHGNVGLKT